MQAPLVRNRFNLFLGAVARARTENPLSGGLYKGPQRPPIILKHVPKVPKEITNISNMI